jgi:hypothetical protein
MTDISSQGKCLLAHKREVFMVLVTLNFELWCKYYKLLSLILSSSQHAKATY